MAGLAVVVGWNLSQHSFRCGHFMSHDSKREGAILLPKNAIPRFVLGLPLAWFLAAPGSLIFNRAPFAGQHFDSYGYAFWAIVNVGNGIR
jgi:hypothetical protein